MNRDERFFGERLEEAALRIGGMRGEECARAIEGSIRLIGGVRAVRVSSTTRSGRVLFDAARVRDWQFERAVRVMGFELEGCTRLGASTSGGWADGAAPTGPRDPRAALEEPALAASKAGRRGAGTVMDAESQLAATPSSDATSMKSRASDEKG